MYKGFKIRIYPSKDQEALFWKHIGSCRFIWNYMLDLQEERYYAKEKHLSAIDMINMIVPLKRDGIHDWLYDVSHASLQITCRDLAKAYDRFYNKISKLPKFKSKKKSMPSYPVRSDHFFFKDSKALVIEKVGDVKYKTDYDIPIGKNVCSFRNVHVSYDNGKWFVGFVTECENQAYELTNKLVGIDLGIKELAVVAIDGEKRVYHNINKSKKIRDLERRVNHLQRSLSRKYENNRTGNKYNKTNNIIRDDEKIRKLYRRLSNIRHNYIHQITHELTSMLPKRIVMEDLNISGMMKNKYLAKSIQDQCLYEFIRQVKYKCERYGIEFVQASMFYPSSKTCSCCGNIKNILSLSDRIYRCDKCGLVIDRDFNAALNLSRYEA